MIASVQGLRTIWLMGAKTRIIPDFIEGAVSDLLAEGDTLVDVCAGTGAVARAFAPRHRIIANDVQAFSATLASAHLEGDDEWRHALDTLDPDEDLDAAFRANFRDLARLAPEALRLEDHLLPRVIEELLGREPGDAVSDYRRYLAATPDPAVPAAGAAHAGPLFEPLRRVFADTLRERQRDPTAWPFALVRIERKLLMERRNRALCASKRVVGSRLVMTRHGFGARHPRIDDASCRRAHIR